MAFSDAVVIFFGEAGEIAGVVSVGHGQGRDHGRDHGRVVHHLYSLCDRGSPVDSQVSCHVCCKAATVVLGHLGSDDGDMGPPLRCAVPLVASS